jgi:hypothetical protein
MSKRIRLARRTFFVDPRKVRRARRALGVTTDAEAVRLSMERVVEMEELRRFLEKSRGALAAGSFDGP